MAFGSKADIRAVALGEVFEQFCLIDRQVDELLAQLKESDYRIAVLEGRYLEDQSMWTTVEAQLSAIGITWYKN